MSDDKEKLRHMQREIGLLRAHVEYLTSSLAHYRSIIGERDKALHGMKKELSQLKRKVKA